MVDDVLYIYVSKHCTPEHYQCLSRRLGGDGSINKANGLLLTIPLPVEQPEMAQSIVNYFSPEVNNTCYR